MNLDQRFAALDDNLRLDPAVRKKAKDVHNRLGDLLLKAGLAKRTRLEGSFARRTMRGPDLHDIDKVVEMVDSLRDILAGPGGPAKAMKLIRDALVPHLPGARFEIKKHALAITLPDDGFDFDAVPAFNPEDGTGWIYIADTDDEGWEPSNTYILIDTIAARNQACDGQFVHQVRMAKQAVHEAGLSKVLPGLHIETFAFAAITTAIAHADAVAATLDVGARLLGGGLHRPDRRRPYLRPARSPRGGPSPGRDAAPCGARRRSTASHRRRRRHRRRSHLGRHLRRALPAARRRREGLPPGTPRRRNRRLGDRTAHAYDQGLAAGVTLGGFGTMLATRAGEATNRRRDRYAEAVQTVVAWIEFPYRVRRRTDDDPATLTALADRGHDLQERLACHEAWIATEHPNLARSYADARATLGAIVGPAVIEAWQSPPVLKSADMNLNGWGPGAEWRDVITNLQHEIENRFGVRRLTPFRRHR